MSMKRRRSSSIATISDESDADTQIHGAQTPGLIDDNDDSDEEFEEAEEENHVSSNHDIEDLDTSSSFDEEDDEPLKPAASNTSHLYAGASGRKRKKLDPSELCQQLYDSVRNVKKEDGNLLCDIFIRAPSRRSQPDYYDVVSNPIDLLRVTQKLKTDAYQNLDELMADFELIINNAKAYYKPESAEYQDACTLWELLNANKQKIISELMEATAENEHRNSLPRKSVGRPRKSVIDTTSSNTSITNTTTVDDDEIDMFEELFASLMTAFDPSMDDRPLYIEFQLLPSRKLYPDYYSIIEQPIDLKTIALRIQKKEYDTLDDMERDLQLMVKNACTYNDPESQIYLDAKSLKEIFTKKKIDLETGRAVKTQSKRRGQSYSAMTAVLQQDEDEIGDEMASSKEIIMMRIFNQLNNQPSPIAKDEPLGATLWRLPNPRWEKTFYETIQKPISMSQIQQKIKKASYRSFNQLKGDFEKMCHNYLSACKPDHRLHMAAKQMKTLLDQAFAAVLEDKAENDSDTTTDTSSVMSSSNNTHFNKSTTNKNVQQQQFHNPTPPVTPSAAVLPPPIRTSTPHIIQSLTTTNNSSKQPVQHEIQRIPPQAKAKLNFHNALVKNKLLQIHRTLVDCVLDGRQIIKHFLELPSIQQYPEYYERIKAPIDMTTIETNIKMDKYTTIDEALVDYRRMFANCRAFNQETSVIYADSKILEKVLMDKIRDISTMDNNTTTIGATTIKKITPNGNTPRPLQRKPLNIPITIQAMPVIAPQPLPSDTKYRQFYDIIRDYRCPKTSRQLSLAFMRLPIRSEYTDYYDLIKNPIDMERIFTKVKTNSYTGIVKLYDDFMLMLKNACSYYETETQIYKDSIDLQRVCFETIRTLRADDNVVPNVQQTIQDLMVCLYHAMAGHEDADGRLYADSLGDVPDHDIKNGKKVLGTTLELIRMRVEKGIYKRLDTLQGDLFACLERARQLTKSNSQVFEDSIELQTFFITKRDDLCRKGEVLSSPALGYSTMHLSASIETIRQAKLAQEVLEPDDDGTPVLEGDSMIINDKLYSPGDFLYYACAEINTPGIMCVERLWINNENIPMMSGNLFLRPAQVIHSRTRKFIDKEVFKSDRHIAMPLTKLQGKCYVMSVKDYFKLRPEGYLERDLYVCESRYNSRTHAFKKIKTWNHVTNKIRLVQRETPIEMKRSLIAKIERSKDELAELEANIPLREKLKPNVPVTIHGVEEGRTYYEQYNLKNGLLLKTGDYIYTESIEADNPAVVQVCAIYETKDGSSFIRGPYLKHPKDLPNVAARMFYKHEILLSTMTETTPTSSILGKCAVMENPEYTTRRPTEVLEKDIYVCESVYDEIKSQIRRLSKPGELKKITHSQMVTTDEMYFFPKPIIPQKAQIESIIDNLKTQTNNLNEDDLKAEISEFLDLNEDSMDIEALLPEAIVSSASPASQRTPPIGSPAPSTVADHHGTTEKVSRRTKTVTGFILYQSQYRRLRHEENPKIGFGEVSRLLGEEWKNLDPLKRKHWKDKAIKLNEEARQQYKLDNPELFLNTSRSTGHNSSIRDGPTGLQLFNNLRDNLQQNQVFDCCWHECDFEFEDPQDLMEHTLSSKTSCIQANIKMNENGQKDYECRWRTCNRIKRSLGGFPDWPRLLRHIREVHIYRHPGKMVTPEKRSVNYVQRRNQLKSRSLSPTQTDSNADTPTVPSPAGSPCLNASQIEYNSQDENPNATITAGPTAEPLFITVPPRPSRILHSEAYIRYIESLNRKAASTLSLNQKSLKATQETTPAVDPTKLPTHWLGKKAQQKPDRVVNALWNLRQYMMKDVLALYRLK